MVVSVFTLESIYLTTQSDKGSRGRLIPVTEVGKLWGNSNKIHDGGFSGFRQIKANTIYVRSLT